MKPVACLALLLAAAASPAAGQDRPYTPSLTCAEVQGIVAQRRHVVLASSPNAYEMVHLDSGACQQEVTAAPAFTPTRDAPYCLAGYRCRQRMNEGSGTAR